jgi:SAM-dependent methyltransferase
MRPAADRSFYAADLAYVHDAGFRGFADRAAPGILPQLRRHCPRGGRVVEIGCGSGGLTRHLAQTGFRVLGVDISPAMLRLARRRAPGAQFRVASYYDYAPPPCAAIVAVGECLNYLAGGRRRHETALRHFFRRAGAALAPGGLLLFDFLEPFAGRPRGRNAEVSGPDWLVLAAVGVDRKRQILTRHITTIRRVGRRQRLSFERHRQCLLRRRDVARWLRAAGFTVEFRRGYGRRRLAPGQAVALAIRGPVVGRSV